MWVTVAGEVNETLHVAPYTDFYNDAINDSLDLQEDFKRWYYRNYTEEGRASAGAEMFFSFCDCPFVLDAAAKSKILQYDAIVQQREQFDVRDQVTPAFVLLVFWGVFGAGSDVRDGGFLGDVLVGCCDSERSCAPSWCARKHRRIWCCAFAANACSKTRSLRYSEARLPFCVARYLFFASGALCVLVVAHGTDGGDGWR